MSNLDFQSLDGALERAFKQTMLLLGKEMTKVITDQQIVDTGRLRSSQQLTFNSDGSATFAWNTEYALYVHEGYTMTDGTVIAGRPWTTIALQGFDIQRTMSVLVQQEIP